MTILEIDGVANVRDVGGVRAATGTIRPGQLLRSASLAEATAEGARHLADLVGHVVDLRSEDEVFAAPSAVDIPTTFIPLFAGSPTSFFERDTSLEEMYRELVSGSGEELLDAIRVISRGEPVLVHCTVGKDRTGVTVALALSAVGADRNEVIADYALTASQLPAGRTRAIVSYLRHRHPHARNAVEMATHSPAEVMGGLLEWIDDTWGSVGEYLFANGMTATELEDLRLALLE